MTKPYTTSTAASDTNMNLGIYGDGTSSGLALLAFRVYYDGAAWQVSAQGSAVDANVRAELKAGLSWHASDYLEIDLSAHAYFRGFSSIPCVSCDSTANAVRKLPADAVGISATEVRVYFYQAIDRTTLIDTEATTMDCSLIMVGLSDV
jgi:hypothetical protein